MNSVTKFLFLTFLLTFLATKIAQGSPLLKRSPPTLTSLSSTSNNFKNQASNSPHLPLLKATDIPELLPEIQRWPENKNLPGTETPDFKDLPTITEDSITFFKTQFGRDAKASRTMQKFYNKIGYFLPAKSFFPIHSRKFDGKIIYTVKCEKMKLSSFVYADKLFNRSVTKIKKVIYTSGYGELFLRKELREHLNKHCSASNSQNLK
ncbi:hypothetical protein HMI54_001201 [Coelomomyces lativittatus]|nr:hypothetical protein HMI56_002946 [Coelomomyces lativittatus]KAJ1510992.1 hypothetical protein HMI54_001201 [Coelomomyces lativittatus]KAJ1516757.1 hypothetical protein HMI55_001477 [Coelomomyces lativittatus]